MPLLVRQDQHASGGLVVSNNQQAAAGGRTATPQDVTLTPGQTVTVDLTGFSGAPTGATINGVAASIANASAASVDVTAPALGDFASAGAHEGTRWNTNVDLVVSEAGGDATAAVQIVPPDTDGPTYWAMVAAGTFPADSIWPAGVVPGDYVFAEVTQGGVEFISPAGVMTLNAPPPATVEVRYFDESAGAWAGITAQSAVLAGISGVVDGQLSGFSALVEGMMVENVDGVVNGNLSGFSASVVGGVYAVGALAGEMSGFAASVFARSEIGSGLTPTWLFEAR